MTNRLIILALIAILFSFVAAGLSGIATMGDSRAMIAETPASDAPTHTEPVLGTLGYDIAWNRIAAGGETFSTGGVYELGGTIGQHEAGVMSNGGYALAGGFWGGASILCKLVDINCDGVVDVSDLLELLSAWGDCPDCNNCPADLNNDCVVDGADLLILLSNWG